MQEYISTLKRIYFKQGDVKKFNQKDFMKEITGAFYYSKLVFCQDLLLAMKEGKLTKDELYGELQIGLKDAYDNYKKTCKLIKIPEINFDEFFLK